MYFNNQNVLSKQERRETVFLCFETESGKLKKKYARQQYKNSPPYPKTVNLGQHQVLNLIFCRSSFLQAMHFLQTCNDFTKNCKPQTKVCLNAYITIVSRILFDILMSLLRWANFHLRGKCSCVIRCICFTVTTLSSLWQGRKPLTNLMIKESSCLKPLGSSQLFLSDSIWSLQETVTTLQENTSFCPTCSVSNRVWTCLFILF